jgi:hypothetical protein
MKEKFADMHVHTRASDGMISPEEAVKLAKEAGLVAVGVADHDSIDGLEAALEAGKRYGIEVIPGVELSAEAEATEVHIIGYYIDWRDRQLRKRLRKFQEFRKDRARRIVDKLRELGVDLTYEEVLAVAGGEVIGRPHVAQVLVKRGYVQNPDEAFDRYLGSGKPAYVKKFELSPAEAIRMIERIGGIPVLAHPKFGGEDMLSELVSHGLRGIEVYHSQHGPSEISRYKRLAREHNLLATGGTNSHGFDVAIGSVRVPYKLVEMLKEQLKR